MARVPLLNAWRELCALCRLIGNGGMLWFWRNLREACGQAMDLDDVETLAAILENERRSHCHKRSICLGMFAFSLACLIAGLGIVVLFLVQRDGASGVGQVPVYAQLLTALSAAVVGFFSMWWSAQNCINSIERTLYAARAGRHRLFVSFIEQLQCTDKKKRRVWLEIVSSAVM